MRILLVAALLAGCAESVRVTIPDAPPESRASLQRARAGSGQSGTTFLGFHVLATNADGVALGCDEVEVSVTVSYSQDGAAYQDLSEGSLEIACSQGKGDLALVVDNSGSENGHLDAIRAGTHATAKGVLEDGGRASLVRVSTESEVVLPLTDDLDGIAATLDELGTTRGWTALWDGIRMGNESLADAADRDGAPYDDLASFCGANDALGIIALTDGRDNNSDDSQDYDHELYPGDGYDTTADDVASLQVGAETTPVYTIGVGDEPDHEALEAIAKASGGRHLQVDDADDITAVYGEIADYFTATQQVCAEIPETVCGDLDLRVSYEWAADGEVFTATEETSVYVECPVEGQWRTLTVLMTMENEPGLGDEAAGLLALQAVQWTTGLTNPSVLVVLDDNHHGENDTDGEYVAGLLEDSGLAVDYLEEPSDGLEADDVAGYDAVWFTNPGYPIDDIATMYTLATFAAAGGGLVLQGDDISQSDGHAFDLSDLTHLTPVANGTSYCGVDIDDNATDDTYTVTLGQDHPVLDGIGGMTLEYGNDIDTTEFIDDAGATNIATATVTGMSESDCAPVPVIVAYDPYE